VRRGTRTRIGVIIVSGCVAAALVYYIIEYKARHLIWIAALAGAPAFYAIISPILELAQRIFWPKGVVRADSRGAKVCMMELSSLDPPMAAEERTRLRAWQRNKPFLWRTLAGMFGGLLAVGSPFD